METSPCEAIKNNVMGTYKTAHAALKNGCQRFVLISTDKAVNPTNIMGASKRLCEMVIQTMDKISRTGREDLLPLLGSHYEDSEEALHQIRKGAKRLRYTAAAMGESKVADCAKDIQTLLGDHQDSYVSRGHLVQQAEAAHAAGEDTFTYGILYQQEAEVAEYAWVDPTRLGAALQARVA